MLMVPCAVRTFDTSESSHCMSLDPYAMSSSPWQQSPPRVTGLLPFDRTVRLPRHDVSAPSHATKGPVRVVPDCAKTL